MIDWKNYYGKVEKNDMTQYVKMPLHFHHL